MGYCIEIVVAADVFVYLVVNWAHNYNDPIVAEVATSVLHVQNMDRMLVDITVAVLEVQNIVVVYAVLLVDDMMMMYFILLLFLLLLLLLQQLLLLLL